MADTLTDWAPLHPDFFANARVLVTGGAKVFIGSHLAYALSVLGAKVVVLDDLSRGSKDNLAGFGSVEFVEGSILDQPKLAECTRGCRFIFHQAALGSVPMSVSEPRR